MKLHSPRKLFTPLNGLWLVAFLLLAAKLLFSLNIVWQIFNFAFQVDESESMIVAETLLMDRGVDIYGLPGPDRFISAPYTPFYYLLNWLPLHFLGASFKPGRLISLLAAVGIGWLIYRFVTKYGREQGISLWANRLAGGLATLAWGSLGVVAFWGNAVKPDVTALFLGMSGLYFVYTSTDKDRFFSFIFLRISPHLLLAAGIFALAALTKQTAFAGVLVAVIWLLLNKRGGFRTAFSFGLVYLGLGFGPMLLMNVFSRGGFWYHIVTVHELPWSFSNYWKFFSGLLQSYQFFILLALLFVPFYLRDLLQADGERKNRLLGVWERLRNNPATFFVLYAGAAWGAGLSAGTYGGNHNHLLELSAAGCICLGLTFTRLAAWPFKQGQKWAVAAALLLVCWQGLGLFLGEARVRPDDFPVLGAVAPTRTVLEGLQGEFRNPDWLGLEYRAPLENQKQRLAEAAAFMTNDRGQFIYSDNVSLMLATGKMIFTTDPFTQTHATRYGRWDQRKLVEMVNRQEFSLVVLRQSIERRVASGDQAGDIYLSPELSQAILANYRSCRPDAVTIYVPKSRTDLPGC